MDEAWLNTVRIARDCGDISSLFPPGITRLWDLPHTLHTAIRVGLVFLDYTDPEKIPYPEDRPPRHIWLDPDKMKQWWSSVKAAQEERAKHGTSTRDMTQNELLKDIFPGVDFG